MRLPELGFDKWFKDYFSELAIDGTVPARVVAVHRDSTTVRTEDAEFPAEPTGKLRFSADSGADLPCVGDWVVVHPENDGTFGIIHAVLPRRSFLRRKAAGRDVEFQMIAANIDVAFIVQSCDFNFNPRRLERYLVMVHEGGVEPVVLLSKSDLVSAEQLAERLEVVAQIDAACANVTFSNVTGDGLEDVRTLLQRARTYCLLGSSGVGKTTLLNTLLGRDSFETSEVRSKDGRGRHKTSHRHLELLESGALIIDTPGMRELALMGATEGLKEEFSTIDELSKRCKFSDCTHTSEVGCAVLAAVESGELSEDRYESYLKLARESAHYEMTYVERRKKDKAFGKMVKSVLKQKPNKR